MCHARPIHTCVMTHPQTCHDSYIHVLYAFIRGVNVNGPLDGAGHLVRKESHGGLSTPRGASLGLRQVIYFHCNKLQHTATLCNTLQHSEKLHFHGGLSTTIGATRCKNNLLQHTATQCNTLQDSGKLHFHAGLSTTAGGSLGL